MFTEAERCLYAPTVADRQRGPFDPLAVRRQLVLKTDNRLNDLLDAYEGDDTLPSLKAEGEVVSAARAAFALTAQQATDAEVIELLYDFLDYLGKPVATDERSPSSSPSAVQAG